MSDDYVREKLWSALDALALSTASLQLRLADACRSALVRLEPEDFAELEARELFTEVIKTLSQHGSGGTMGSIEATARELDDEAALALARKVMALHALYFPIVPEER